MIIGFVVISLLVIGGTYLYKSGIKGQGILMFLPYMEAPIKLTDVSYEYSEEKITIKNGEENIRATLYVPEDGRKTREILIFSHGFNCQSALLANKAKSLAAAGIPTMIFDFRGGSLKGQSDGSTEEMTVRSEISDLNAVIDTVKSYEWVEQDNIYLMGESFGGLVSALTAAKRNDVAGLILCFPALHSADASRALFETVDDIPDIYKSGEVPLSRAFWEELWEMDVYEQITKYTGDVILFHGTQDSMVDYSYSVKANELFENSELVLVEGCGHAFGGDDAKTVMKSIYYFVKSRG